jgi:uncharacterized protein (TIGR02147 family)
MIQPESDYRRVLRRELEVRCQKSARYSLRAFARDLKISPSRLSEVLNGKQGLSRQSAVSIGRVLGWSTRETEVFGDLVESQHARGKLKREMAKVRLEKMKLEDSFHALQTDTMHIVSDWYHFAILQLLSLPDAKGDVQWIASSLGISAIEASGAIERLARARLIEIQADQEKIKVLKDFIATPDGTPSTVLKKMHRDILARAAMAHETLPLEERSYSAVFLPIDRAKLPEAKRWIKNFRRRFCKKLSEISETTGRKDAVYCLSMQFFSLTQKPILQELDS